MPDKKPAAPATPPPPDPLYLRLHEDPDGVVRDLERKATERLRELQSQVPNGRLDLPRPSLPQASPELWPGESMDLGGFGIA